MKLAGDYEFTTHYRHACIKLSLDLNWKCQSFGLRILKCFHLKFKRDRSCNLHVRIQVNCLQCQKLHYVISRMCLPTWLLGCIEDLQQSSIYFATCRDTRLDTMNNQKAHYQCFSFKTSKWDNWQNIAMAH